MWKQDLGTVCNFGAGPLYPFGRPQAAPVHHLPEDDGGLQRRRQGQAMLRDVPSNFRQLLVERVDSRCRISGR